MGKWWRALSRAAAGAVFLILLGALAAGAEEASPAAEPPGQVEQFNEVGPLGQSAEPVPAPRAELRAFWVDAFHPGLKTPEEVDRLVDVAARANINTLIVQVRRRGDAYYNLSPLEPRTEDPALPAGFDALAYVIDRAHARGIEVHAWLATLAVVDSKAPPQDPGHVWNAHGPAAPGAENWVSYHLARNRVTGTWSEEAYPSEYLDPGHPAALDYTVRVYLNVVQSYAVDGIHLDLCRYAGPQFGYNPVSVARYNARYGTTGRPEPDDLRWSEWRREQVTNLVRKVYLKAIALRPEVKVSVATIAWGKGPAAEEDWESSRAYAEVFQDWRGWLAEGIIDLALPMNYDRERDETQRLWYDQWLEWEKDHQYRRQVAIGPGIYLNRIEESLEQIRRAQAPSRQGNHAAGVALYSYASTCPAAVNGLTEANSWFFPLLSAPGSYFDPRTGARISTQPVFPTPAPIPDMPWKSRPERGFLMGTVFGEGGAAGGAREHLEVTIAGPETRTVYTDGSGWFGAADLLPGEYRVSVWEGGSKAETPVSAQSVTVQVVPGRVSEVGLELPEGAGESGALALS